MRADDCVCGHGWAFHNTVTLVCECIGSDWKCQCPAYVPKPPAPTPAPVKCAEVTKDSGHRKTFDTGSQRDAPEGKGRYDLISPLALRRLALVLERGAAKYQARNWEKGQPMSQYINSALRHTCQYLAGMRDEDHLGQAMWNLHAAIHTEEMVSRCMLPAELADLPDYEAPMK